MALAHDVTPEISSFESITYTPPWHKKENRRTRIFGVTLLGERHAGSPGSDGASPYPEAPCP